MLRARDFHEDILFETFPSIVFVEHGKSEAQALLVLLFPSPRLVWSVCKQVIWRHGHLCFV